MFFELFVQHYLPRTLNSWNIFISTIRSILVLELCHLYFSNVLLPPFYHCSFKYFLRLLFICPSVLSPVWQWHRLIHFVSSLSFHVFELPRIFFCAVFFNITCYFCFSFYMKMLQLVLQDRKQHGDFSFIPFYTYFLSLLLLPCYPGLTLIVCFQWQAFARHLLPWHEYKNNTFHSVDSSLTYSSEKFIFHHRSCRYRMVVV